MPTSTVPFRTLSSSSPPPSWVMIGVSIPVMLFSFSHHLAIERAGVVTPNLTLEPSFFAASTTSLRLA